MVFVVYTELVYFLLVWGRAASQIRGSSK